MTALPPEPTDEDLMARLASRDDAALRELHRRHAALVFTVAARVVGAGRADEIVQEVFLTLWTKHASFDPTRGRLAPWLARIARRQALNGARRGRREQAHEPEDLEALPAEALEPDEEGWLAYRRRVIRSAVDALPEAQRRAISLAFFDELTHEQVSVALGTPLGTTKTRIRSALQRLAPALLVALAAAVIVVVVRRRAEEQARVESALRMVTASDATALRLSASPGAPPEAHGNYRARPGENLGVLTTSHLPALAGGEEHIAWAHGPGGWRRLGKVVPEADGRSLLVTEVAGPPDELRVTRETSATGDAPRGPTVIAWPAPGGTGLEPR